MKPKKKRPNNGAFNVKRKSLVSENLCLLIFIVCHYIIKNFTRKLPCTEIMFTERTQTIANFKKNLIVNFHITSKSKHQASFHFFLDNLPVNFQNLAYLKSPKESIIPPYLIQAAILEH